MPGARAALSGLCFGLLLVAAAGLASASTSSLCDAAAARAARETGVPVAVLLALTRTETGRGRGDRLAPWPWTVNVRGAGHWFDTREGARGFADQNLGRGTRSFDVGCFQINYKWHGAAFTSVDQMFEPLANARYAAAFLARLHAELGDWSLAAGAYHSRTETLARRYRARFGRIVARLAGDPPVPQPAAPLANRAPAPLVPRSAGRGRNGSLVPLGRAARAFIPLAGRL